MGSGGGKGKGGGKGQEYYEYYANFAMGLCEGPAAEVLRIWADSNLIFDKYNRDEEDVVDIGFSEQDSGGGGKGGGGKGKDSGKKAGGPHGKFDFRFYTGSETQMPDPFMVQKNGSNPTPAHRGLCYLFFEHFPLKDFGNRTPTISAEIKMETADRKPVIKYWEPLPGSFDEPVGTSRLDPFRTRIYTFNGENLRVWDATNGTEIDRIPYTQIHGEGIPYTFDYANPDVTHTHSGGVNGNFLGVAASGNLVWSSDIMGPSANSIQLAFVDPNSYLIKSVWGDVALFPENKENSISQSYQALIVPVGDSVEGSNAYFTCIVSLFGQQYFFNDKDQPVSYMDKEYGLGNSVKRAVSGYPKKDGAAIYVLMRDGLFGDGGDGLYRFDYPLSSYEGGIRPGVWAGDPDKPKEVDYTKTLLLRGVGFSTIMPVSSVGTQFVGLVVSYINSSGPYKGTFALKIDYNTGAELWRERISEEEVDWNTSENMMPQIMTSGIYTIRLDNAAYTINFVEETITPQLLPADFAAFSATQFNMGDGNTFIQYAMHPDLGPSMMWVRPDMFVQGTTSLEQVIRDISVRAGIPMERMDTTQLKNEVITGMQLQNPAAARQGIETLNRAYFFDIVESDFLLKVISREDAPTRVSIPEIDLGTIKGDASADNPMDYYKETRMQEIDLPQTVVVSYKDQENKYQTGSQHVRRPRSPMGVMQSREVLDVNLPIVMEGDQAKQISSKILYSLWAERVSYEFALPWKYVKYDPADEIEFVMEDGLTLLSRMSDMDFGADMSIQATGVAVSPGTYSSDATAQPPGGVIPVPSYPAPVSVAVVFDLPYFEDSDSVTDRGWAYYWGVVSYGAGFRVAAMERSTDRLAWDILGSTGRDLPWGTVQNRIPPPPYGDYAEDTETRLIFHPAFNFNDYEDVYQFQDIEDADWPDDANTIVVGEEIIYFKHAIENVDGTVTLHHLIRGARGTENAAYNHLPLESGYLIGNGIVQDVEDFIDAGAEMRFRALTVKTPPGTVASIEKKMTSASHKPWAPWDIRKEIVGPDVNITWNRRTRLGGKMQDGTANVPNVEGVEEYEVYILSTPYDHKTFDAEKPATYIRKFTALTTTSVLYTAAMLGEDGKTKEDTIQVVVFQRNIYIGRGFPGWATLYTPV